MNGRKFDTWEQRFGFLVSQAQRVRRDRLALKSDLRNILSRMNHSEVMLWREAYGIALSVVGFNPQTQSRKVRNGTIPSKVIRAAKLRANGRCEYCGEDLIEAEPKPTAPRAMVFDHIVPRWAGGPATEWNVVVSCYQCNQGKGRGQTDTSMGLMIERIRDAATPEEL